MISDSIILYHGIITDHIRYQIGFKTTDYKYYMLQNNLSPLLISRRLWTQEDEIHRLTLRESEKMKVNAERGL